MTAGDPVFIDTNVLIYASVAEAPLHGAASVALHRLRQEGSELWVSHQVLREYMASLSRPGAFKSPPSMSVLITTVRGFLTTFRMTTDFGMTDSLLTVMGRVSVSGKQIHDANVVATMHCNGLKNLLTHNIDDFRRYSAFITVVPLV